VEQRLHVFYRRGKCERPNAAGVAIERHYIVAAPWAVLEHEHFPAAFITEIEQFIAGASQKAGEVEISGLEDALTDRAFVPCVAYAVCS
jgi:hypothetical protein